MTTNGSSSLRIAIALCITATLLMPVQQLQAQSSATGTFTPNFNNVDIHSLIATISEQTGKNFIVDPRVNGKITVTSSDPLNSTELYNLFLSVLSVHGYAAVGGGNFIKIVPTIVGNQSSVPVIVKPTTNNTESDASQALAYNDELITEIIPVKYAQAQQLVEVLRALTPAAAGFSAEPATNTLIITDTAANIDRLKAIIIELDQPH